MEKKVSLIRHGVQIRNTNLHMHKHTLTHGPDLPDFEAQTFKRIELIDPCPDSSLKLFVFPVYPEEGDESHSDRKNIQA